MNHAISHDNMRHLLVLLGAFLICSKAVSGHEIEGTLSLKDKDLPAMARTQIPFDTSEREVNGRTYVLWMAPDGAIAFHIEDARTKGGKDSLTHLWIVQGDNLKLPKGFEKADIDKKDQIEGVEKLQGTFRVDWRTDLDYTIFLDVKGSKGIYKFKGYLYGGPQNKKM
jgi:hypothetical protein